MSDEDKDVDIESDEDEFGLPSPSGSGSGFGKNGAGQFQSQADKRAHHNALERKRRDHIKDSFSSLRDAVPSLQGEKVNLAQASRAQILKKAADYIQFMRRKNTSHQQDIDDLKRQNKVLEEQSKLTIRSLERNRTSGSFSNSSVVVLENSNHMNNKRDISSSYDAASASDTSDMDDDEDEDDDDDDDEIDDENHQQQQRKKLKTSPDVTPVRI